MRSIPVFFATLVAMGSSMAAIGQKRGWQNLDLKADTLFGISTEKAYAELLKGKRPTAVIVAVIDSGIDTTHEDLRSVIWTDPRTGEHGWNYIGAETGREDITKLVEEKKDLYAPHLAGKIRAMQHFIKELDPYDTDGARQLQSLAAYHLQHGLNIDNKEADTATGDANISPDLLDPLSDPNDTPLHGTHVAGIIAAVRNNGKGMDGIADDVQVMMLKVNGNIRELRDRSLARAIRYAVDHGAKVINISMGKPYTWDKAAVDEAVKYAMEKDVIIVHAAGNDGRNIDVSTFFPNPVYVDGSGKAGAWLTVGASRPYDDTVMVAAFSDYGKMNVDVFAPGTGIYSTLPGSKYEAWDGTSMAAPVVAGLAALIREYYPALSAVQVKDIIMRSVVKVTHDVYVRNKQSEIQRVPFSEVCVSAGVVNAYNALKLAGGDLSNPDVKGKKFGQKKG